MGIDGHKVTVYETRLAELFAKHKDVARFSERFADTSVKIAKKLTPGRLPPDPRPGKSENLKERNRHRGYLRAGRYLGQIVLENNASYARYAWRRGPVTATGSARNRLTVPRVHMRLYSAMGDAGFGSSKGMVYVRRVGPVTSVERHWLERAVYEAVLKFS